MKLNFWELYLTISYLSYHISGSLKANVGLTKALNLLRVLAHTTWGADQETLHLLTLIMILCRNLLKNTQF